MGQSGMSNKKHAESLKHLSDEPRLREGGRRGDRLAGGRQRRRRQLLRGRQRQRRGLQRPVRRRRCLHVQWQLLLLLRRLLQELLLVLQPWRRPQVLRGVLRP
jgi:hypothetical protein